MNENGWVVPHNRRDRLLRRIATWLNKRHVWHGNGTLLGFANLLIQRLVLERFNLYDTYSAVEWRRLPVLGNTPVPEEARLGRMPDGSFNDLSMRDAGKAKTRFGRNLPPAFCERRNVNLPDPGRVANKLLTRDKFIPATGLNLMVTAWIQFMVHDWFTHQSRDSHGACRNPPCSRDADRPGQNGVEEDIVKKAGSGPNPLEYLDVPEDKRDSTQSNLPPEMPTFLNQTSHWWDGSQIYGTKDDEVRSLRLYRHGKLKTEMVLANGGDREELLTTLARQRTKSAHGGRSGECSKATLESLASVLRVTKNEATLEAKDIEGETREKTGVAQNWWVGLSLFHTLFTLEHNSICDRLRACHPCWDDDELFRRARLINAALMAKIHVLEWTPQTGDHDALRLGVRHAWWGLFAALFGEGLVKRFGRFGGPELLSGIVGAKTSNFGIPFSMTEEFAAAYRMHPLLPDDFTIRQLSDGATLPNPKGHQTWTFSDLRGENARKTVLRVGMANLFYSFATGHPGRICLFNYPNSLRQLKKDNLTLDLAQLDIIRDRERGVPPYNRLRELLHLPPVLDFDDFGREYGAALKKVYHHVDDIDPMIGMFAEAPPPGFAYSDTCFRVFILMASRRLQADRFYTADFRPEIYSYEGIDWINDNDLKSVLLRHYPALWPVLNNVQYIFKPWQCATNIEQEGHPDCAAAERSKRQETQ